jgi:cell division protein FtsL
VLGATLVAIVGLRVEVLRLGSSVGSQVQQATALQSSNSVLRAQISALSDNQRIAKLAEGYGMRMPDVLDVHFVQAAAGTHVAAAIHNISAPSRTTFLSGLATEQQTSQQSAQAIAAQNGVATSTGTGTSGTGSSAGTSATTPASSAGVQSSGTTAASTGGTTPVTGGSGTTAGTTAATSYSSTPAAGTGVTAGGGTSGTTSDTSQSTISTGSTNGGTGLAG